MLGWLRATQGDRVISQFRSRKAAALLAYLAYYVHRSHPREVLIELLWPGSLVRAGRTNLRTELSWLRQRLEPPGKSDGEVVLADGDTVRLNPERCVSDVALFEASLEWARQARGDAERTQALEHAVRLFRGELLPGYFEPWLMPERLRLTEAYLQAIHHLVIQREQTGDLPGALRLAWRGAAVDPGREETHIDVVRLLHATGQHEAASRQSQHREQTLGQEWGDAPDSRLSRVSASRARAVEQQLRVRTAEAEELQRQLAARTTEAEALHARLQAETAEKQRLRQELAVRTAEAEALGRQLEQARSDHPGWSGADQAPSEDAGPCCVR